jgi:hypothetical protein
VDDEKTKAELKEWKEKMVPNCWWREEELIGDDD